MKQIFHPSMNTIAKMSIIGLVLFVLVLGGVVDRMVRSPFNTDVGVAKAQPVPFSHLHHVSQLGLDCQYCHTSVTEESFAGIPDTHTCMTCHSQIYNDQDILAPVRESYETAQPLKWERVHNLSEVVYFNHSIHVAKGVGCETCHGRVDEMSTVYKESTLFMEWCLDCHRTPEEYIRPAEEIFTMGYQPAEDQLVMGRRLVEEYNIEVGRLDNCSICHR